MEVSFPLDSDGFIRRECPHCEREFKWHHGPANKEAEQQPPWDTFYCPLCGEPAGPDSWWTQVQLELIENAQERLIGQELGDMLKGLERSTRGNKYVGFKAGKINVPDVADPLVEPDDMTMVTSPCHAWEPIKVPQDHVVQSIAWSVVRHSRRDRVKRQEERQLSGVPSRIAAFMHASFWVRPNGRDSCGGAGDPAAARATTVA